MNQLILINFITSTSQSISYEFSDSDNKISLYNSYITYNHVISLKTIIINISQGIIEQHNLYFLMKCLLFYPRHKYTDNREQNDILKFNDEFILSGQSGNNKKTDNCGWYGCRVARSVNNKLVFWHGGNNIPLDRIFRFVSIISEDKTTGIESGETVYIKNYENKYLNFRGNFVDIVDDSCKWIINCKITDNKKEIDKFDVSITEYDLTEVTSDKIISSNIEYNEIEIEGLHITGNIDINQEGTYHLQYNLEDSFGNKQSVIRTITIDNTAPEVPITLRLNGVENNGPFKADDQVVINCTFLKKSTMFNY